MKVSKSAVPSVPIPELRGTAKHLKYPCLAQLKVDGEFNFLVYHPNKVFLVNKYGTVKQDFPALNKISEILEFTSDGSAMLACEVYWGEGKLGALYDFLSHKKDDNLKIAIFDLLAWNGDMRREPLINRLEALHELGLGDSTPQSKIVNDEEELYGFFDDIVNQGYEGVVAKPLNDIFPVGPSPWTKLKYKDQSDWPVVAIDPVKERIEVAITTTNLSQQPRVVNVGVKAPNRYKAHIKIGDLVTIEHQGILPSGSIRHPVLIPKKEW